MQKMLHALRIPAEWSGCRTDYPRDQTVHALFEDMAAKCPHAVAIRFQKEELSYGEVNRRANRLAQYLLRQGIGSGDLVGLCVERSPDLVISLIAILKAGASYVPFDSEYPDERIAYMIGDTHVSTIICSQATSTRFTSRFSQMSIACLEAVFTDLESESDQNPTSYGTADDLAYVMYTSGSSGTPKGVMVPHRGIVRLVRNTNYCDFGPDEVFLHLAPISFDASTFEIWGPLLNGARLAIMPPGPVSLDAIGKAIRDNGVTTLWLTAGLFHLMVEQRAEDLRPIRQLVAGGDVLSPPHVERALATLENGVLINGYGPTESTTFACCFRMKRDYRVDSNIPIGSPIANTLVYILDESLVPVPVGEIGELFIGGDGLARGYLNLPELTNEKFISNPFASEPNGVLYRTGDRVRYLRDGNIEFLGRVDRQVKIAGHRIEPGEIEAILREHPAVRQAAVVAVSEFGSDKRLMAYVVFNSTNAAGEDLRAYLAQRLPKYMIPSVFVPLQAFPLSPNGKLDRAALPSTSASTCRTHPPDNIVEATITSIWERVLGCGVGPNDNFFDLGGDSLLLIEVHSELQKQLSRDVNLIDLFEVTTVRALAGRINGAATKDHIEENIRERARKRRLAYSRPKYSQATQ